MKLKCDFRDGVILFDYFYRLKVDGSIEDNEKYLTEDLFSISYFNNKYIIDVGYYTKDSSGLFIGKVVYEDNWEEPQIVKETTSIKEIEGMLADLINFIYNMEESNI